MESQEQGISRGRQRKRREGGRVLVKLVGEEEVCREGDNGN